MTFLFAHSDAVRTAFPSLAVSLVRVEGITNAADAEAVARPYIERAIERLSRESEGEFPEVQAWRRAFSTMGLKPTQYRCASEALLRRLRKEGDLPSLHPLVDVCNALSVAYAIPIAVFDLQRIASRLVVRPARGDERYESFSGSVETPEPGEIIFADEVSIAHSRRWTNRQSAASAVGPATTHALIVAEALHAKADSDIDRLNTDICGAIGAIWPSAAIERQARS